MNPEQFRQFVVAFLLFILSAALCKGCDICVDFFKARPDHKEATATR